jgi:uncharacterized membrane protein YhhN
MSVVPWCVMAVLVAALLWVHATKRLALEWLVKPAAAGTFVVAGIRAGALDSGFGKVMLAGLLFAAAGDVLLIPKSKRTFLFGLVAFLLGHVGYAIACVIRGVDVATVGVTTLVMGLVAVPILRWLWPHVERPMRVPVAAYVTVITSMVALAAGAAFRTGAWPLLLGAVGFYLSDLSVARDRFVSRTLVNKVWGLPLYFFSQLVLATSSGPP